MRLLVAITSCTTFLSPFLTKILISKSIDINLLNMFLSIVWVVILPIILGVLFHKFLPKFTNLIQEILPIISAFVITFMVIVAVN
ncbi:hypothetical protein F1B92_00005 [Campylobacter sp. FMV-PI01]|uniref:Uncharacterized protein n=1 Tax=Campylobacter portucalensis TaxID=2608384 RepID=A0A6L5WF95_9BACT|nr:bile acid:sodium symporter [Campylobacter portucalensis]MSN95594.1 hypothetical protein [Campylobacter portucalensis]